MTKTKADQVFQSPDVTTIDVRAALTAHYSPFLSWPSFVQALVTAALRLLIKQTQINRFLHENAHLKGADFIEQVFAEINVSYTIMNNDLRNIPEKGAVIIVANHPLGGLDGLGLLHLVSTVRPDVKIVSNQLLTQISPLSDLFLAVDNLTGETRKQDIKRIEQALIEEQAVIFFPSGEVSRATSGGIKDRQWNSGFLRFAERCQVPVVPVCIQARNSAAFYLIARLSQTLSMLCLPREMIKFSGQMRFYIGAKINTTQLHRLSVSRRHKVELIQRHVYSLQKMQQPPVITAPESLSPPQNRSSLQRELERAEHLGQTADGKSILFFSADIDSTVLNEIGRLREQAFRAVGEGTGACHDIDQFDHYYRHIVLWDEQLTEIVGAYRLGEIWAWPEKDKNRLYSSTLFSYQETAQPVFEAGLELGRSFVQPRFWGMRSLDYLWQGIGAYIARHPKVGYLFGPVSLSASLPERAKALLVRYYAQHYPDPAQLACSLMPYRPSAKHGQLAEQLIPGRDKRADFRRLTEQLDQLGVKVPTLYKQYTAVCETGGVRFSAFNVDPQFSYCVDGLVCVDLRYLTDKKRQRYLLPHL
ncbi:putative hemolysin [SAR116 cluster alpha proteobacterium HIMB100]|nr:putative hemolysin [SAR116 cluster alpha proteobacterium HIMB100]